MNFQRLNEFLKKEKELENLGSDTWQYPIGWDRGSHSQVGLLAGQLSTVNFDRAESEPRWAGLGPKWAGLG
jgi:hypothetical protein